jgi:general secretion pathway protein D
MHKVREAFATVAVGVLAIVLSACSASMVRKEANQQLQAGQYEQALVTLREGVKRYPDEATLRAGAVSAQQEIATRLINAASDARAAGRPQEAEAALQRLLAIDPNNSRARALLLDVARDRRQATTAQDVRKLIEDKKFEQAQPRIETALKDDPRNPELLALQRRVELELRSRETQDAGLRLADTRPITLEFRDVNLKMLIDALSRTTGVDFILDKDVRPDLRATLFLRNSRLEDALEVLVSANQLSKKLLDPRTVLLYPNTPEKQKEYQDLVVKAFYLANAEAKSTAALLKSVLKIREPFVDDKLNLIIVRESPETIRLAERLVALHDVGEPEVLLEVEVLEIKASRLLDLGIKFPESFSLTPLPPSGSDILTLRNAQDLNRDRIGLGVSGINVNLRRDVGDLNLLANPRIRAKNREKAKILVGDKLPIITSTTSQGGVVSETVTYLDVGLKLDVEPQVSLDDEVTIRINMEVSSLAREVKTAAGSLAYQVGTRTASTALKLRDGETQLLAGLISNEDRMNASRVPGVGDLPVLSRLFGSQRDSSERTEVVLSITPRIIKNVRRPDVNFTEFWSGSETNLRLRPLTLASRDAAPAAPAKEAAKPGGSASASTPGALPPVEGTASAAVPPAATLDPFTSTPAPANPLPAVAMGNTAAPPAATAAVTLQGPDRAKAGTVIEVQLRLKTDIAVRGLPANLEFDPQRLEVVDIVEGGFFKQNGAQTSVSRNVDPNLGRLSIGIIRNSIDGVAGEDTVLTLKLRTKTPGAAFIRLISATPIQLERGVTPRLGNGLTLTVEP